MTSELGSDQKTSESSKVEKVDIPATEKVGQELNDLYGFFCDRLTQSEHNQADEYFPWVVTRVEGNRSTLENCIEVRLSEDFAKQHGMAQQKNDPPIFRFYTARFPVDRQQTMSSPLTHVEVNIVGDSADEGRIAFERWGIRFDAPEGIVIDKPPGLFRSEGDLIHDLKPLMANPSERDLEGEMKAFISNKYDQGIRADLISLLKEFRQGETRTSEWLKRYDEALEKSGVTIFMTFEEYSQWRSVRELVAADAQFYERQVEKFVQHTDKAYLRKKIGIGVGVGLGLIAVGVGVRKGMEIIGEYRSDLTTNDSFIERERQDGIYVDQVCRDLEARNQKELADVYRNIYKLSKRWGVGYKEVGTRFLFQLRNVSMLIEEIANGNIDASILDVKPDPRTNINDFIDRGEYRVDENSEIMYEQLSQISLRNFVGRISRALPWLAIGVQGRIIEGTTGGDLSLTQEMGNVKGVVRLSAPWGSGWINNMKGRLNESIHELTHSFHAVPLNEVYRVMSLRDYIRYMNDQMTIASEVADDWIEGYGSADEPVLFNGWATNYKGDAYDAHILVDVMYKKFPEYHSDLTGDELTNDFFHWALARAKDIDGKMEKGEILLPGELDFIVRYRAERIGDWALSHITHHLEYVIPVQAQIMFAAGACLPDNLNDADNNKLNVARYRLFGDLCRNVLGKSPEEVYSNLWIALLGDDLSKQEIVVPVNSPVQRLLPLFLDYRREVVGFTYSDKDNIWITRNFESRETQGIVPTVVVTRQQESLSAALVVTNVNGYRKEFNQPDQTFIQDNIMFGMNEKGEIVGNYESQVVIPITDDSLVDVTTTFKDIALRGKNGIGLTFNINGVEHIFPTPEFGIEKQFIANVTAINSPDNIPVCLMVRTMDGKVYSYLSDEVLAKVK